MKVYIKPIYRIQYLEKDDIVTGSNEAGNVEIQLGDIWY